MVGRQCQGLAQQVFCFVQVTRRGRDQAQHAQGIHVPGFLLQHLPAQSLCLLQSTGRVVLRRPGHHAADGRQGEAALKGGVRLRTAPDLRQRLAQLEVRGLLLRVQSTRLFQQRYRPVRLALLQQQRAEVLVGFGEGGREVDDPLQYFLGLAKPALVTQRGAEQAEDVHVVGIPGQLLSGAGNSFVWLAFLQ